MSRGLLLSLALWAACLPAGLRAEAMGGSIRPSHQPKAYQALADNLQRWLAKRDASKAVAPFRNGLWGTWNEGQGKRPATSVKGAQWNIYKLKEGLYLASLRREVEGSDMEQESFVLKGDQVTSLGAWHVKAPIDRRGLEYLVLGEDCAEGSTPCAHVGFIIYGDARIGVIAYE